MHTYCDDMDCCECLRTETINIEIKLLSCFVSILGQLY